MEALESVLDTLERVRDALHSVPDALENVRDAVESVPDTLESVQESSPELIVNGIHSDPGSLLGGPRTDHLVILYQPVQTGHRHVCSPQKDGAAKASKVPCTAPRRAEPRAAPYPGL